MNYVSHTPNEWMAIESNIGIKQYHCNNKRTKYIYIYKIKGTNFISSNQALNNFSKANHSIKIHLEHNNESIIIYILFVLGKWDQTDLTVYMDKYIAACMILADSIRPLANKYPCETKKKKIWRKKTFLFRKEVVDVKIIYFT